MRRNALLALAMFVALASLFSASFVASERPVFSHKKHIEEGAGCKDCHVASAGQDLPALNSEFCKDCHEEPFASLQLPAEASRLKSRFPHALHAEALECEKCHEADAGETRKPGEPFASYADCTSCHEENGVKTPACNCIGCHGRNERLAEPATHTDTWTSTHGSVSEWSVFGEHGKDCNTCHRTDACTACHRHSRPQSHSGLWRIRLHGKAAEWDRNSCKTCHETGSCVACHKTVAPLNHTGAWLSGHGLVAESRSSRYCAVCHNPGYCAACHAGR